MKAFLKGVAVLLGSVAALGAGAQDPFGLEEFPRTEQLYGRTSADASTALAPVTGWVLAANNWQGLEWTCFSESGQAVFSKQGTASGAGDTLRFALNVEVPARLENHTLVLKALQASGDELELYRVEGIVAGDIFYITGQSNAEAGAAAKPEDWDDFSRSFTYDNGWAKINFSFPGQWGGRLAKELINRRGVPVAIFNEAVGGEYIDYFLPTTAGGSGHFENAQGRLATAGVQPEQVRAAMWFQGEADGWEDSVAEYRDKFAVLQQAWRDSLGVDFVTLFQVRRESCGHPKPNVMEAQRQAGFAPNVYAVSTLNAAHDSCHFYYEEGYAALGNRLTDVVEAAERDETSSDAFSPGVSTVTAGGPRRLWVTFSAAPGVRLQTIGNPWADWFVVDRPEVQVLDGRWLDALTLELELSHDVIVGEGISYVGHPGPDMSSLTTASGLGVLTFHDIAIEQSLSTAAGRSTAYDFTALRSGASVHVEATKPMRSLSLYDVQGRLLNELVVDEQPTATITEIQTTTPLVVVIDFADGTVQRKLLPR